MVPIPKAADFTTLKRLRSAWTRRGRTWTILGGKVGMTLLRSREYGRQVRAWSKLPTQSKVRIERTEKQEEEEEQEQEQQQQQQQEQQQQQKQGG